MFSDVDGVVMMLTALMNYDCDVAVESHSLQNNLLQGVHLLPREAYNLD